MPTAGAIRRGCAGEARRGRRLSRAARPQEDAPMQREATTPTGRLATAVARPPKLPWCATHVVKACHELTPAEKLTWCEHMMLDNGLDGCYAGAGPLAARLGCSRHTVEIHRRRFVAAALLTR